MRASEKERENKKYLESTAVYFCSRSLARAEVGRETLRNKSRFKDLSAEMEACVMLSRISRASRERET